MSHPYERDTERAANLIFATLTIAAGVIWSAADYSAARAVDAEITRPPASSGASATTGALCSSPGPTAQAQAAGTAAREPLLFVSLMEGPGGKSGS